MLLDVRLITIFVVPKACAVEKQGFGVAGSACRSLCRFYRLAVLGLVKTGRAFVLEHQAIRAYRGLIA
jgi:hypothetical protein